MKIAGSDINIEHPDIKGKNIQDLKKLDIFSHLSLEEQEKAYAALYAAIQLKVVTAVEKLENGRSNVTVSFEQEKDK